MAEININDLNSNNKKLNGSELFDDSENFLEDLNNQELDDINGGFLVMRTKTYAKDCGGSETDTYARTCGG